MSDTDASLSIVRRNLLSVPGYAPYCGSPRCSHNWPRATWDTSKQQFLCSCGWASSFDSEFVKKYAEFRINSQKCSKCGVTVGENKSKYCGDGSDKDNPHRWVRPSFLDFGKPREATKPPRSPGPSLADVYEILRPEAPNADIMTNDVRLRLGYIWIRPWKSEDKWTCTYTSLREDVARQVEAAGGLAAYLEKMREYEAALEKPPES